MEAIQTVINNKHSYIEAMKKSKLNDSIDVIMNLIKETQL